MGNKGLGMSTVIAFPTGRIKAAALQVRSVCAEVVIFPGVRVERREFNLADRLPPRRRKRRARDFSVEETMPQS